MIQKFVFGIVTQYLSEYIENLDASQFSVEFYKGEVNLNDLKLKPSCIESAWNLPFRVVFGSVEKASVEIPWTSLLSNPVIIHMEEVYIVAIPSKNVNPRARQEYRMEKKKLSLKSFENTLRTNSSTDEDSAYYTAILQAITNNIEFRIENVHIRIEDTVENFCLGFCMDEFNLQSCDEDFVPTFVKELKNRQFIHTVANLKNFSLYGNEGDSFLSKESKDAAFRKMKLLTNNSKNLMLSPTNSTWKLTMQTNKKPTYDHPKFLLDAGFSEISMQLRKDQYHGLLKFVEWMSFSEKEESVKDLIPFFRPTDIQMARKWWKSLFLATEIVSNFEMDEWEIIERRLASKERYIDLYKRNRNVQWLEKLSSEEIEELESLEISLDLQTIMAYREIGHRQFIEESKLHEQNIEARGKEGWIPWAWGYLRGSNDQFSVNKLTDEQRQWIRENFEYSDTKVNSAPEGYISEKYDFTLGNAIFELVDDYGSVAEFRVRDFLISTGFGTGDSIDVNFSLTSFVMFDKSSKDSKYEKIISKSKDVLGNLSTMNIAINPSDEKADIDIKGQWNSIDIVCNTKLIQKLGSFFSKPADLNFGGLRTAASSKFASMQSEFSMKNLEKTLDIDVNINAPNFLFPTSLSDTEKIVFRMGNLQILNVGDSQQRRTNLKHGVGQESDFFDQFRFVLRNFAIFANSEGKKEVPILEDVKLNIDIFKRVTDALENIPAFKVESIMQPLTLLLSPDRFQMMFKIWNNINELISDPTGETKIWKNTIASKLNVKLPSEEDWKSCWCELRKDQIHVFESQESVHPKWIIHSLNIRVENLFHNKFRVRIPSQEPVLVDFETMNEDEKELWVRHLRASIQKPNSHLRSKLPESVENFEIEKKKKMYLDTCLEFSSLKIMLFQNVDNSEKLSEIFFSSSTLNFHSLQGENNLMFSLSQFSIMDFDRMNPYYICKQEVSDNDSALSIKFVNRNQRNELEIGFESVLFRIDPQRLWIYLSFYRRMQKVMEQMNNSASILKYQESSYYDQLSSISHFQLDCNFVKITVQFIDVDHLFTSFQLERTSISVSKSDKVIGGTMRLNNMKLIDHSDNSLYHDIISFENDGASIVVEFDIAQNQMKQLSEGPQFTKFLKIHTEALKFVLMRKYFLQLRLYFLNGKFFQEILLLGQSAKDSAKDLLVKQSKDIEMLQVTLIAKDQEIIFPINSRSRSKFIGKISLLKVENTLEEVIERFTMQIHNMKFQTLIFPTLYPLSSELEMNLTIDRTVVGEVPQDQPVFDVDIKINPISLYLSHHQYEMIFSLIDENFGDTTMEDVTEMNHEFWRRRDQMNEWIGNSSLNLRIKISIEHLKWTLQRNSGGNEDDKFVFMILNSPEIAFYQQKNGKQVINMQCKDIHSVDQRIETTNDFKNFIFSNVDEEVLLRLNYAMDRNLHKGNLFFSGLTTVLIPDLALEMKEFFTSYGKVGQKEDEDKSNDILQSQPKDQIVIGDDCRLFGNLIISKNRPLRIHDKVKRVTIQGNGHTILFKGSLSDVLRLRDQSDRRSREIHFRNVTLKFTINEEQYQQFLEERKLSFITRPSEGVRTSFSIDGKVENLKIIEPKQQEVSIQLNAKFNDLSVVLPKDLENKQSIQLMVKTSVEMEFASINKKQTGNFQIKDFQAYFQHTFDQNPNFLISPFCFKFRFLFDEKRKVWIELSQDLSGRISFHDLEILQEIATNCMKQLENSKDSSKDSTHEHEIDENSDEYSQGSDSNEDDGFCSATEDEESLLSSGYLKIAQVEKKMEDKEEVVLPEIRKPISISMDSKYRAEFIIVNDFHGYDIPLVKMVLSDIFLKGNVEGTESIMAALQAILMVFFFNQPKSTWEPIIEPWSGIFEVMKSKAKSDVPLFLGLKGPMEGSDEGMNFLNVNVSSAMLQTLMETLTLWKQRQNPKEDSQVSQQFSPFLLRNFTGYEVTFIQNNPVENTIITLLLGEQKDLTFDESQTMIDLKVPCFPKTIHVCINKVCSKSYVSEDGQFSLFVETIIKGGRKIITLRSAYVVKNLSSIPWEVGFYVRASTSVLETHSMGVLSPGDDISIPLYASHAYFSTRPVIEGVEFNWSKSARSFEECKELQCMVSCKKKGHTSDEKEVNQEETWFAILRIFKKDSSMIFELRAPFKLHNHLPRNLYFKLSQAENQKNRIVTKKGKLEQGENLCVYNLNLQRDAYLSVSVAGMSSGRNSAHVFSPTLSQTDRVLKVHHSTNQVDHELQLSYAKEVDQAQHDLFVSSNYCIVNHSTFPLKYVVGGKVVAKGKCKEVTILSSNRSKLALSLDGVSNSKEFTLNCPGLEQVAEVPGKRMFEFIIYVQPNPKTENSKYVTITPRFHFRNESKYHVTIRQCKTQTEEMKLLPNEIKPWFFPRKDLPRYLELKVDDKTFIWSNSFPVDTVGKIVVKLMNKSCPLSASPLTMEIAVTKATSSLYFYIKEMKVPQFLIQNDLDEPIEVQQQFQIRWISIAASDSTSYSWDDYSRKEPKLSIRYRQGPSIALLNPNKLTQRPIQKEVFWKNSTEEVSFVQIEVIPKGVTRIIRFFYLKRKKGGNDTSEPIEASLPSFKFVSKFCGIGLSCILDQKEVCYLSLTDLLMSYEKNDKSEVIEATVGNCQIDNQSNEFALHPVLFSVREKSERKPWLRLVSSRRMNVSLRVWNLLSLVIQKSKLSVDADLVVLILDYIQDLTSVFENPVELSFEPPEQPEASTPMYFDQLILPSIEVQTTFNLTKISRNKLKNPIFRLMNTAGLTFVNCTNSPIRLNGLKMQHILFPSMQQLKNTIGGHYRSQTLTQLYTIIGSLDIIGNPLGLLHHVGAGVSDFFVEPFKAEYLNPYDFASGLAKGTDSLVTHTVQGLSSSSSRFTNSISRSLASLTLDEKYIENRENNRSSRPVGFFQGYHEGSKALWDGIKGTRDIFLKPIEGASKDGAHGFFQGLSAGALSASFKPINGLLDFSTKTTEGISNWRRPLSNRVRFIRCFGEEGELIPYDPMASRIQYFLRKCGKVDQQDYQLIVSLPNSDLNYLTLLTNHAIVQTKLSTQEIKWKANINIISSVETTGDTIIIQHMEKITSSVLLGRTKVVKRKIKAHPTSLSTMKTFAFVAKELLMFNSK